jgi:hypothetical protein
MLNFIFLIILLPFNHYFCRRKKHPKKFCNNEEMNQKPGYKKYRDYLCLTPFFLYFILLTWFTSNNIFFWDTVQLGAKHALFYYENDFSEILLPDSFDSGHIPAFGMYLALCWKIFGKSLAVSHFSMLPFLFGIVWQSYQLLKKFISPKYLYFALVLFLLDPTLLGQAVLVSPDIVLVFFFLLALNSVLSQKKIIISIAITGLALTSMRGMMVAFAILILDLIFTLKIENLKSIFIQLTKKAIIYSPALIIFLSYNIYHFNEKGWIGYHENSPWAECFQFVGFKGIVYNIGILGWRILDFGRVFLWIAFFTIGILFYKRIKNDTKVKTLLFIFIIILGSLSISFVLYKNLSGHRYILPAILSFSLLTSYLVFEIISSERMKYLIFSLLAIGLITGNMWIYPREIAQGWDASLAHLPYYELREKMLSYMEEQEIKIEEVASFFPNNIEVKYLDLSVNELSHTSFNSASNYVLYSNIFNDVTDEEWRKLENEFFILKEYKKSGIYIRLFKKIHPM